MKARVAVVAGLALGGLVGSVAIAAPPTAYRRPGHTNMVSVTPAGRPASYPTLGTGELWLAQLSDLSRDGRYIVWMSHATNLVPSAKGQAGFMQIYWRDTNTRVTRLVSVGLDGLVGTGESVNPSVSGDGRFVVFESDASNLVAGDTNAARDVFWHDMRTGMTRRVSVTSNGTQTPAGGGGSSRPSISDDGTRIEFDNSDSTLAPGDTNNETDTFVHDLRTHKTTLVSVGYDGKASGGRTGAISGDGRYVVFTAGPGIVRGVDRHQDNVYVRDLSANKTLLASAASDGAQAQLGPLKCGGGAPIVDSPVLGETSQYTDYYCTGSFTTQVGGQAISDDGRYVTFASSATNLVPNPGNCARAFCTLFYVHDMKSGRTERVDVDSYGRPKPASICADSYGQTVSGTGRYVAYGECGSGESATCTVDLAGAPAPVPQSVELPANDLIPCFNSESYIYDHLTGTEEWLTRSMSDGLARPGPCSTRSPGNGKAPWLGAVSDDGRFFSFSSDGTDMVAGDSNRHCDLFVRDRGPALGVGEILQSGSGTAGPSPICVVGPVCLPPAGNHAAQLIHASVVTRPTMRDLYVRWDLARLGAVAGEPDGGVLYDLRFTANGHRFEVRAQRVPGPDFDAKGGASFGLFRCDGPAGTCLTKVATLKGGYGTVGEAVVTAVPPSALGLTNGGKLRDVTAFTAVGSYLSGATKVLDSVRLSG